jgi:hypothetical protein
MKCNFNSNSFRGTIAASALATSLCFLGAAAIRADDDCQKRVEKADHRLHEAAEHHGWDSSQAAKYREELYQARSYCWAHNHRWWSEDDHRWHTDRDWDDHDHDHVHMDHPQK